MSKKPLHLVLVEEMFDVLKNSLAWERDYKAVRVLCDVLAAGDLSPEQRAEVVLSLREMSQFTRNDSSWALISNDLDELAYKLDLNLP